jgi:3-oxoadipate enol-lactonase
MIDRRSFLGWMSAAALAGSCVRGVAPKPIPRFPKSTIQAGSLRLAYSIVGSGEPVLLLHGAGGDGASWEYQIKALSERYQVIFPDQRGHGASSVPPGPYTIKQFASDALALCQSLNLEAVHVMGHSLGGMVALSMALSSPSSVRSLSIINSTSSSGKSRGGLINAYIKTRGMARFARQNCKLHLPDKGQEPLCERLVEVMGNNPKEGYIATQGAVDSFDVSKRLHEIKCPTLIVHSAQDAIPKEDKDLMTREIKGAKMVTIEDSRHVVLWDQPERLNQCLLEFLSFLAPSTRPVQ